MFDNKDKKEKDIEKMIPMAEILSNAFDIPISYPEEQETEDGDKGRTTT